MQATNSNSSRQKRDSKRISLGRVAVAGLIAAVAAAIANTVVYAIAVALGSFPDSVLIQPAVQPMSLGPVISASAIGAVCATIVFALMSRFFRRPVRSFVILSVVVLVISLITPFTVAGATAAFIAALLIMHVVALAVIVFVLAGATVPRENRAAQTTGTQPTD